MQDRQSETSKSIFRNVLYGFSTWLLPLGLSFIATRFIIKSFGEQEYGVYQLILGFVGYSFTFNFGRSLTKYISEFRATGENERIPDLISSAFFINLAVGLFSVAVICLFADWLVLFVLKIEPGARENAVTGLYIASAIIFFTVLNQLFNSILQGIHRFDIYSKIFNLNNFVLLTGNLLLAIYGYKLIGLFVWNLSVTAMTCLVFAYSAKKNLPEFKLNFRLRSAALKLIVKYSSGVVGYQILSNFLVLFERGWITRQLGSESLAYYVVPMNLAINIQALVASLVMVTFPLASELKNDTEKLLRLYTKATKIVLLFVTFMGTTLIVESKFFLTLWIGAEFGERTWLLLIVHTITFSIVAVQTVSWQMTEGLGYPNYNFKLFLLCLVISVSLMVGLTPAFDNLGVAIGRMTGYAAIFFSVFYVEKWFFGKILWSFWLKAFGILSVASVFAALTESFVIQSFSQNWLVFVGSTAGGMSVFLCIVWVSGFISEDEKLLFKRLLSRSNEK
ncbi:MAG: oligosaccharide flippase family protein [Pyrinomonadaceae bacterium]